MSPPLLVATSRFLRWRGLRGRHRDHGLVLAGSMVHGRGIQHPLRVVGLDERGAVTACGVLLPGKFIRVEGARYILELPLAAPAPRLGAVLVPMVRR